MMRIVTVTLNPAIDMTVGLAEPLARGSVNLAESVTETPGGKGINVASFLADWGLGSSVTGLIGADNVGIFEGLFREKGLDDRFVRVPGKTRTNVKIVDGDETTDVNLPGLRADAPALRSLETILLDLAKEGPCIVSLSGSLPKGCGTDIYANLTQKLRDIGAQVMLDTSGEALKTALDAPVKPFCAKPNRSELAAWTGRTIETEEDLIRAARALLAGGWSCSRSRWEGTGRRSSPKRAPCTRESGWTGFRAPSGRATPWSPASSPPRARAATSSARRASGPPLRRHGSTPISRAASGTTGP